MTFVLPGSSGANTSHVRPAHQHHYRSTLQPLAEQVSLWIATSLHTVCDHENIAAAAAAAAAYLRLAWPTPADLWACTAHISLIFLLLRFLFFALLSNIIHTTCLSLHAFSRNIAHICSKPLFLILEILALPLYFSHQIGYSNLPPRKEGESIVIRYASIASLVPLWFCAFAATMVLIMFGTVFDFFGRTVKSLFSRKPEQWKQLDVERGAAWRPDTPRSSRSISTATTTTDEPSTGAITPPVRETWEELRRSQAALGQEKEIFEAAKAAWELDAQRQKEEKSVLVKEREQLENEKLALQEEKRKWKEEVEASAAAKAEVEAILKSFIERAHQNSKVIAQLRQRVGVLPAVARHNDIGGVLPAVARHGDMMGNPTPPGSPKTEQGMIPSCPTPPPSTKNRISVQAAAIMA